MTGASAISRRAALKSGGAVFAANVLLRTNGAHAQRQMSTNEKALYEAAKKEGEITWYTAHSDDGTAQALGRDFEALYPGIKAQVVRTTAHGVPARQPGDPRRRHAGRRVLVDRHGSLRVPEG
jgi:hypothetical protein